MRIVALVPGGIGDQVLFFPTLDHLKQIYPNATIDVVVEPQSTTAYRVCKSVNETITFDFKANNSPADWANLLGVLRDRTYDLALSAAPGLGIRFLLWLTGIPVRIGYGTGKPTAFLTQTVPFNPNQYAATMYHDLLRGLQIEPECPALSISIPRRDLDWAEIEQKRLGIAGGGYVLIDVGFGDRTQPQDAETLYPLPSWTEIIQDFHRQQPDLPLVTVQEPEDSAFIAALVQSNPRLKVSTPDDVGKLAAMVAGASLVIGIDGAAVQLAVALQVFTLALLATAQPAKLLPAESNGAATGETRFLGIQSPTGNLVDIAPATVLQRVWGG